MIIEYSGHGELVGKQTNLIFLPPVLIGRDHFGVLIPQTQTENAV
jgi:hypothetical protein